MKYIRLLLFAVLLTPLSLHAAPNDFMVAAQLLSAAKNADIQQVQILINSGADVNYTDSTGLSIVCTALMNNDMRAAQILQMYGADASRCDRQIKNYNNRTKPKGSGGLFSGLSSAQTLTLAAAGAAVVVGGLLLLTDVFDPGNGNNNSGSGGNRPNGGDGSGGGDSVTGTEAFALAYGPAMPNAAAEAENYTNFLNYYSPSTDGILKDNFKLMTDTYQQNYLLIMNGYSPLARGYLGMRTLRDLYSKEPISLTGYNLGSEPVLGGRPTNVALVTANGINSAPKPAGELSAQKNSLDDVLLPWTTMNGASAVNGASNDMISSKYFNNLITLGTSTNSVWDDTTAEDAAWIEQLDLSGHGTAINNTSATSDDDLLAKIVGGRDSGYTNADFFGFMPNGQMTIFRTGAGKGFKKVSDASRDGTFVRAGDKFATGDTITLFDKTLTLTVTGNVFTATDGTTNYKGYIGANGLLYIDGAADGVINQAYTVTTVGDTNKLVLSRELGDIDYYNYRALSLAAAMTQAGDLAANGRSRPDVLANASIIAPLYSNDTKTINDVLAAENSNYQTVFAGFVDSYYDRDNADGVSGSNSLPSADAVTLFNAVGTSILPLLVFSTGGYETDSNFSGKAKEATFENAAPLVFNNLEHLFMSVVAVGMTGATGTGGTTSVAGFSPANKYALAQWSDTHGTTATDDDTYYRARVCGVAGRGSGSIDPWCFASAGVNAELAVASAAGAAGAVKSAFDYLDNRQLFALLALTADGPYLGTFTNGNPTTKDALRDYLQSMYILPNEYDVRWLQGGEDYLDVFKEVFGYGLINLDRATKPGTKVYYYNGDNIVSASGNAYWRASSNTMFRGSSAFRPRVDKISAPFFDVLESVDGDLRMPRVWQNEFSIAGDTSRRALYMGDVLGDLKTRDDDINRTQIGNLGFSMTHSQRAYNDNLSGLDTLRFDYSHDNWNLAAGYQHYLTDGASRFDGMSNPILGLASNAIVSDAEYNFGRWSFGGRVYSGEITDEGLLENDPTVTSQFNPARLGLIQGAQTNIAWHGDKFGFSSTVGNAIESDTILGAQTGGLLNLGGGNTTYIDTVMRYAPWDNVALTVRSTFARTTSNATGDFILGMSDIDSNAFGVGLDFGNISLSVAQPLAVSRGAMQYAHAQYDVVDSGDGKYDLVVRDTHVADIDLRPDARELRFAGTMRHKFGAFTDGAVGFIYRIHPNHCDDYGNESIFMLKLTHRLGI